VYEWVQRLSRHRLSENTATADPARSQAATDGKGGLASSTERSGSNTAHPPAEIEGKAHESGSAFASPVTFQVVGSYLYEETHTSAQVDDILQRLKNRSVTWEGWIANVSLESDGGLSVFLKSRKGTARAMAFLSFPPIYRSELLPLNRDQRIRASCTFVEFSGLAFILKPCQLLQVVE